MKEFVALIVLSMPIIAVLCIGGLAGYAGWAAARRMNGIRKKWLASGIGALAVILIFVGDEIAGRVYFHYLCHTVGGVKVIKRAGLPAKYWGDNGIPQDRIVKTGSQFETQVGEQFYIQSQSYPEYSGLFRIEGDQLLMRVRSSDEVLSELIVFRYWGGWLVNTISLDLTAESCPAIGIAAQFYRQTFMRTDG